ncbi:hypothetical protein BCR33DRAFT_453323 [Rhizoclosmatium globosum]|uniref:Uncharacterized protein n=1 Tax=Rhizoclosmatium globosum TaxID=329046 RepID=A0A1Y2CX00_9FUNG|nr:hypothetical protein BCR33DRAFT_453323 [Rhizoclosmatium globosum]|eukprot:ORY51364.1 hypothetical protein BCR33DRAFT_453323 [Rhizoclosmatium globosum]
MHSSATPEHSLSNVNASDVEIRALTLQLEELSRQHQADLEICEVHERKVPILREDSVLLDEDVMELTRRLDKAQRLLIQVGRALPTNSISGSSHSPHLG